MIDDLHRITTEIKVESLNKEKEVHIFNLLLKLSPLCLAKTGIDPLIE